MQAAIERSRSIVSSTQAKLVQIRDRAADLASGAALSAKQTVANTLTRVSETTAQTKAVVLDFAASAKEAAVSLRADFQKKGIRVCGRELAASLALFASQQAFFAKLSVATSLKIVATGALGKVNSLQEQAVEMKDKATEKAKNVYTATGDVVGQRSFQTTAASATAGAVALGAGGAATGTVAGGVAGAVAGLPLALFTFGLSIPVGAVVGGGAGCVLGTAAGATTGFVGGGATGYGLYTKRGEIRTAAGSVATKVQEGADSIKGRAVKSVVYTKGMVVAAKARLAGAGTGETAEKMD